VPLRQGTRRFGFIGIGQARPGISARQVEEQLEAEGFALTRSWSTPDDDDWRVTRRVTTVSLEEKLMSEVHAAAQRSGLSDDEVIEQALRRFVDLEVFDEVWSRNRLGGRRDGDRHFRTPGYALRTPGILSPRSIVRIVLDPNALISAALSSQRPHAQILREARDGYPAQVGCVALKRSLAKASWQKRSTVSGSKITSCSSASPQGTPRR
jgi:hypothetical protein